MPEATLYLVRHGEAFDPNHVVYADLPGFPLSKRGRAQARRAARWLSTRRVDVVATSPLQRATETAQVIAAACDVEPSVDDRLGEWALTSRWAGTPWSDLDDRFPGELQAYLTTPYDLPFSPESLRDVATRMAAVVGDVLDGPGTRAAVLVSHQDPIQALRLTLLGRSLSELHESPPRHGRPITMLRIASRWKEEPAV